MYNMCMIKLLTKLPREVTVCCSGGPDSMAALHFLMSGRRNPRVLHFDHGTASSKKSRVLVEGFCIKNNIPFKVHKISGQPESGESLEAWWRSKRYEVMNTVEGDVVTGHNLNDVAEWWIFTALRGNPRLMPYKTGNVIKPFILCKKIDLEDWCRRHKIPYIVDPTNLGTRFARSRIRNNIMPEALEINPGLLKTMSRKIREREELEEQAHHPILKII